MNKSELVELLQQGRVTEFNRYRDEHPDERIDLYGANLIDAGLPTVGHRIQCVVLHLLFSRVSSRHSS